MNIVFRADASKEIGSGHVMRCMTLASLLKESGHDVSFICAKDKDGLTKRLLSLGKASLKVFFLEGHDAVSGVLTDDVYQTISFFDKSSFSCDWLILDHYGLGQEWENQIRPYVDNIAVIDDLADREHDCDLLLDQTLGREPQSYKNLVPEDCTLLLGPDYGVLRPEFAARRQASLERRINKKGVVEKILVFAGSTNLHNITSLILSALLEAEIDKKLGIEVVLASGAPYLEAVKSYIHRLNETGRYNASLQLDAKDMADIMAQADLVVGAGGTSSWERCVLGVPTLNIEIAENQVFLSKELERAGAVINLGWYANLTPDFIAQNLVYLVNSPAEVLQLSRRAAAICDGSGTKRVVTELEQFTD